MDSSSFFPGGGNGLYTSCYGDSLWTNCFGGGGFPFPGWDLIFTGPGEALTDFF